MRLRITDQMLEERDEWLGLVSELTGIDQSDIMGTSRVYEVTMARHLLCWALHSLRGYSYPLTGMLLGKNHATITHSNNVIVNTYHSEEVNDIINQLKQHNYDRKSKQEKQCITMHTD